MAHGLIDKTVEFEDDDRNQVAKPYGYKNFFKKFQDAKFKVFNISYWIWVVITWDSGSAMSNVGSNSNVPLELGSK